MCDNIALNRGHLTKLDLSLPPSPCLSLQVRGAAWQVPSEACLAHPIRALLCYIIIFSFITIVSRIFFLEENFL